MCNLAARLERGIIYIDVDFYYSECTGSLLFCIVCQVLIETMNRYGQALSIITVSKKSFGRHTYNAHDIERPL